MYRNWPDAHAHVLPSFITNDSNPSTSALNSAFIDLVAGQFTAGSCRAAARAFPLENCGDLLSTLRAAASLLASSIW
jgi:hypothetical protein